MQNDYISRENAVKTAWMIIEGLGYYKPDNPELEATVKAVYATCPAADVRPVVRGEWSIREYEFLVCSACGKSYYTGCESTGEAKERLAAGDYYAYCPSCGADMRGGQDDA